MNRWAVALVVTVLVLVGAVPLAVLLAQQPPSCGGGQAVQAIGGPATAQGGFSAENVGIARAAAGEAATRHLPRRALVVILATGFQESGVRNLTYGDRDSVGWLQQRAGWGPVAERMNPRLAAGKFYDHLVRISGWEQLPVTVAAQRVQISAYPDAYARWQAKAEQLAALVAGTSPVDDTTPDDGTAGCSGITANVATWNPCYCNSQTNVITGLRAITAAGADVVGTQEMPTEARRRAVMAALPGYTITGLDTSTPMWFRTAKYELVREETQQILPRHMPFEGPVQGARFLTVAQLRDRQTGQVVTYLNTHMLPRVQLHGHLNTGWPRRIAAYRKQLRVVVDTAQRYSAAGPVVVMGDFNFHGDPDGAFGRVGMRASWQVLGHAAGAKRERDIDQVWSLGAVPSSQQVLGSFGSDHNARLVRFVAAAAAGGGGPVPVDFNRQGNPRTVEQAIAWMQASMPSGAPGEPVQGACERYMNLAYGLPGGYPTALAHWNAAGPRSLGYTTPPRGALVFWRTGNPAGHVALSLGNGIVVSTDYNAHTHRYQARTLSAGPIGDIDKWGPRLGWRTPNFRAGTEVT